MSDQTTEPALTPEQKRVLNLVIGLDRKDDVAYLAQCLWQVYEWGRDGVDFDKATGSMLSGGILDMLNGYRQKHD